MSGKKRLLAEGAPTPIMIKRQEGTNPIHPSKSYVGDAGFDLTCLGGRWILPFQKVDMGTGWDIKIPDGYWGMIKSRSSTFVKRGLIVMEGVIDSNYTGPLSIVVFNPTPWLKRIERGARLAQLIPVAIEGTHWVRMMEKLPVTIRGRKGFGSSGR